MLAHEIQEAGLEALRPILDTALDAVVIMRADGKVADWNQVAEAIFGWTREEAVGRSMGELIIPPQHREGHRQGLERFNRTGVKRILNQRIEITALDKSGREFPVELSVTCSGAGEERLFVGFVRDITARRETEAKLERQAREARLMFEVTRLAADSDSFEEAISGSLKAICNVTGWPVGHALVVREGWTAELVSTSVWHEDTPGAADAIREATAKISFTPGTGLPGEILQSMAPAWISDADQEANFLRKGLGFSAAFGFPLTSEGRIIGVLEFFTAERTEPDPQLLLIVRSLGEQVGRVLERKRTEEHQRLMTKELNHRVRNTLAVVQSVASQSFRDGAASEAARQAFESRLGALAAAHDVLTHRNWEAAPLAEVVSKTVFGCGAEDGRISLEGPDIWLPPKAAVSLTMALHELCTNAVKYGAYSTPDGKVHVAWALVEAAEGRRLRLEWREAGGPVVTPPKRRGFGSRMIERALARELGGSVELRFLPEGLHCVLDAPAPSQDAEGEETPASPG